ncbi:hypothetical protein SEVIR_2G212301v4 [Setaria viridis]
MTHLRITTSTMKHTKLATGSACASLRRVLAWNSRRRRTSCSFSSTNMFLSDKLDPSATSICSSRRSSSPCFSTIFLSSCHIGSSLSREDADTSLFLSPGRGFSFGDPGVAEEKRRAGVSATTGGRRSGRRRSPPGKSCLGVGESAPAAARGTIDVLLLRAADRRSAAAAIVTREIARESGEGGRSKRRIQEGMCNEPPWARAIKGGHTAHLFKLRPIYFGPARYCITPILAVRFRSSPRDAAIYIPLTAATRSLLFPSHSPPASLQGLSTGGARGGGEMVQRLTYRKRHSYATKSNQTRVVKTPGGKLVYQYTKKRASGPKCPVTGKKIQGIPHLRPAEYKRSRLSRNRRTVNRPYGGVLSGTAVRERIIRAFLVEEQKIVKKVLKIQKTKDKTATK